MAAIKVYNTLTQKKEKFVPKTPGRVSIYVCGVTPYADAHIGHARPSVVWDVIKKFFRSQGYQVVHVQNFTDVDDRVIERSFQENTPALEISARYTKDYLADMDALKVERADFYPKVSEHIEEIIELVKILVEKGYAYEHNGDVYFHVPAFSDYGKLSKQKREELIAGTRFEVDPAKRDAADFALWKKAKPKEPAWESPWGAGRPGWHIECSAMSHKYLGPAFDFHGGGSDLIFPHHENEIAQSEAATGKPLARYWVHNGMLNFKDTKMSKSVGNVVSIAELTKKYPAELIRYYLLSTHYRSGLDYYAGRLEEMARGWRRLNDTVENLKESLEKGREELTAADKKVLSRIEQLGQELLAALADDFNTAKAIGVLFELVREVNAYSHAGGRNKEVLGQAWDLFELYGLDILGIITLDGPGQKEDSLVVPLMDLLLELREEAREEKNYALADKIRDALADLGIAIEDTAEGPRWR